MYSFSTTCFPCALQAASVWRMLFLNNNITTIRADGQWPRGSVTTTDTLWDKHGKKEKREHKDEKRKQKEKEKKKKNKKKTT